MGNYLTKFANESEYNAAKLNRDFKVPNVSLIMSNGQVKYTKTFVPSNIGIYGGNGVCYSLDDWNALLLQDKPTPVGAYLWDEVTGKGFVIHGTVNNSVKWSDNTSVQVPGVTTATNQTVALQDMNGLVNSNAVLDAVSGGTIANAPVFTWARGLNWIDPNLVGYVPSVGELNLIKDDTNLAGINACRAAIGQSELTIQGQNFWTSTQCSASGAWLWYSTRWNSDRKSNDYCGLALAAF